LFELLKPEIIRSGCDSVKLQEKGGRFIPVYESKKKLAPYPDALSKV